MKQATKFGCVHSFYFRHRHAAGDPPTSTLEDRVLTGKTQGTASTCAPARTSSLSAGGRPSASKSQQVQASASKCKQVQASASKCKQVQASASRMPGRARRGAGEPTLCKFAGSTLTTDEPGPALTRVSWYTGHARHARARCGALRLRCYHRISATRERVIASPPPAARTDPSPAHTQKSLSLIQRV